MKETRWVFVFAVVLSLLMGVVLAKEWWEKKVYVTWSAKDVQRMLDDSPWGRIHTVTIVNPMFSGSRSFESVGGGDLQREKKNRFHLRLLTAKPIRMAIARDILLRRKGQVNEASLDAYVQQPTPDTIVLAMSLSSEPQGSDSISGYWTALANLGTPHLTANTFLATDTGRRVYLTLYEAPSTDGLGAKFHFPRNLPDGTPLITSEDREIRFETRITVQNQESEQTDRIWGQFDLEKMLFDGKLEI